MASLVDTVLEGKTCDALREFLRNNGLHTSGKKAVLIQRIKQFLVSGNPSSKSVSLPSLSSTASNAQSSKDTPAPNTFPTSGWQTGSAFIVDNGVTITRTFIYEYLVDHVSPHEAQPANNFRALKGGYNAFASGHVQSISMCKNTTHCFYKGIVLPTMKKDKTYTVLCSIQLSSKKIDGVQCTCPAGLSQSCIHLSALLHAVECLFTTPRTVLLAKMAAGESKTSLECTWVKPRKRKVAATCATDLHYVKHEYGTKLKRKSTCSEFDPRPPSKRDASTVQDGKKILVNGLKGSNTCAELVL